MPLRCFFCFYIFVQCNYHITSRVNFFLSKIKMYFRFFNLGFLKIILRGQGYFGFSIIKKKNG